MRQAMPETHRRVIDEMRDGIASGRASGPNWKDGASTGPRSRSTQTLVPCLTEPVTFMSRAPINRRRNRTQTSTKINRQRSTATLTSENVSLTTATRAELEAWTTLTNAYNSAADSCNDTSSRHPCRSESTGALGRRVVTKNNLDGRLNRSGGASVLRSRERPSSARVARKIETLLHDLERYGPSTRAEGSSPSRARTKKRPAPASAVQSARKIDACRAALAAKHAARQKECQQSRSDMSGRFLKEHARKAQEEERAFQRTLKAEARAVEDSQVEIIHRASQRAKDLGEDAVYVPHRVGGKLHVLKINVARKNELAQGRKGSSYTDRSLDEYGKILSVEFFTKTDHARLERQFYAHRDSDEPKNKLGIVFATGKASGTGRTSNSQRPRTQPTPEQTRQGLHQLIRDTAGLVEMLTGQAVKLERQGWNRNERRRSYS